MTKSFDILLLVALFWFDVFLFIERPSSPNNPNKSSTLAVVVDLGADIDVDADTDTDADVDVDVDDVDVEGNVVDVVLLGLSSKSRSNKFSMLVLTCAWIGDSLEASSCSLF